MCEAELDNVKGLSCTPLLRSFNGLKQVAHV